MRRSVDPLVVGRVIGDVLEPFTTSISLRILYNNRSELINCSELKPSQIINPPRIEVGGDDLRNLYTLIMVDPDAPSPGDPHQREYLHWLVANIPATTGANFGEEIVCYENPQPLAGIHRIVFVLFRQLGRQMIHPPGWRQNFNIKDFAQVYNLGKPVAAMYFTCKRDTVPRNGRS